MSKREESRAIAKERRRGEKPCRCKVCRALGNSKPLVESEAYRRMPGIAQVLYGSLKKAKRERPGKKLSVRLKKRDWEYVRALVIHEGEKLMAKRKMRADGAPPGLVEALEAMSEGQGVLMRIGQVREKPPTVN